MDISPQHKYNYEKYEKGMKGGMRVNGDKSNSHLSVPIGVIVIREHHDTIPYYAESEPSEYDTIDDELFDKLLEKCSKPIGKDSTQKNRKVNSKTKKNKKH
jgi:hypothetical protein